METKWRRNNAETTWCTRNQQIFSYHSIQANNCTVEVGGIEKGLQRKLRNYVRMVICARYCETWNPADYSYNKLCTKPTNQYRGDTRMTNSNKFQISLIQSYFTNRDCSYFVNKQRDFHLLCSSRCLHLRGLGKSAECRSAVCIRALLLSVGFWITVSRTNITDFLSWIQ